MLLEFRSRNVASNSVARDVVSNPVISYIKTASKKEFWVQNMCSNTAGFWAPPSGRAGTPRERRQRNEWDHTKNTKDRNSTLSPPPTSGRGVGGVTLLSQEKSAFEKDLLDDNQQNPPHAGK